MKKETKQTNNCKPEIQNALAILRKKFGEEAAMTFNSAKKIAVDVVSTGSLGVDLALGIGGIPLGRISEIYGPESSGKSTICIQICAEAQKKGYNVAYIDLEHSLDPTYMRSLGCDLDNMIISQPSCGEDAFNIATTLLENKLVNVIIFDSVAAMLTRAEITGEVGDMYIGRQAKLMSDGLKKITPLASRANCACVFVNQIRDKIGVMFGSPETTSGGNALKFYASVRMRISRTTKPIEEHDEAIGNDTHLKVIKNKLAPPFRETDFKIFYGEGVSKVSEILDHGVKYGLIGKSGSFYRYDGATIGQGELKALAWLKSQPEVQETLLEQMKAKMLDEEVVPEEEDEIKAEVEIKDESLQEENQETTTEAEN